ncbi:MAG TPA: molybdopterin-dependent oxidoreductase [Ilumatobacter sp.]|nr:molybdopterin-dependent oxidoreductase [Ilumatobacter sp.]
MKTPDDDSSPSTAIVHDPPASKRAGEVSGGRSERLGQWVLGIALGLAAAMAGLASAEVVAIFSNSFQSPVLDVGDRVVDGVPNSVKELAIEWFGTNDKQALLAGIASILTVYASLVGIVAVTRRWRFAVVGIALFGLAGAYASQSTRRDAPWHAVAPSLVGGLIAAATLVWLRSRLIRTAIVPEVATTAPTGTTVVEGFDRRKFVAAASGVAVGSAVVGFTGRSIATRSGVANQRNELGLPIASDPLAEAPSGISADGATPFFTPNDDFYRIDTALTVPQVSVDGWRLTIRGLVDQELSISYDELLNREIVEHDITLTCVSNEVGGSLMGTARWLGVRLDDLLRDAGIKSDADQIVGRSVDGYTCGFPTAALDGRDALVAIGMNGEPLPLEHGYPARLIVPGLYGYVSATKWLKTIELTRFDQFDQYWVERGWVDDAPIKLSSRIDTPRGLSKVPAGTIAVAGVAWAQTRGIERVELQFDEGEWVAATLADELNDVTWRQWSYAWTASAGNHSIRVRATETGGLVQTEERVAPFPSGATGLQQIVVIVE